MPIRDHQLAQRFRATIPTPDPRVPIEHTDGFDDAVEVPMRGGCIARSIEFENSLEVFERPRREPNHGYLRGLGRIALTPAARLRR